MIADRRFFERVQLVAVEFQLLPAAVELVDPLFDLNPAAKQRDLACPLPESPAFRSGNCPRAADLLVLRDCGLIELALGLVGFLAWPCRACRFLRVRAWAGRRRTATVSRGSSSRLPVPALLR